MDAQIKDELVRELSRWADAVCAENDVQEQIVEVEVRRGALEEKLSAYEKDRSDASDAVQKLADEIEDTPENVKEMSELVAPYVAKASIGDVVQ